MNRLLALLLVVGSCALVGCHSGGMTKQNTTQVVLTSNNYRVLQTGLKASSSGMRFLGIGPNAHYYKAMGKLRILAELDDRPRALINVTEDYGWFHFGIVAGETITLTADVVEFTGPPTGK